MCVGGGGVGAGGVAFIPFRDYLVSISFHRK